MSYSDTAKKASSPPIAITHGSLFAHEKYQEVEKAVREIVPIHKLVRSPLHIQVDIDRDDYTNTRRVRYRLTNAGKDVIITDELDALVGMLALTWDPKTMDPDMRLAGARVGAESVVLEHYSPAHAVEEAQIRVALAKKGAK